MDHTPPDNESHAAKRERRVLIKVSGRVSGDAGQQRRVAEGYRCGDLELLIGRGTEASRYRDVKAQKVQVTIDAVWCDFYSENVLWQG